MSDLESRDLVASTPVPTAVLPGVVTGAGAALAATVVFQLVRLGFWAADRMTLHAGQTATVGLPSGSAFIGRELLPSLISLGPALLAGALLGGLTGLIITQTWDRQGPLRAALTGALATFVVALVINATVLGRHRTAPLTYTRWSHLIGYPSVLFVLVFAGVGASLYVNRARQAAAPTTVDLRTRL
ncbi:hypothetical protein [Microlunatus flavus]|uniref:Uncharacterized protein n=1 Tax=Microlunatus flavus TaxID=1036181 RepID=A0A1H8ZTJ1_9ACTN|nr:hypothetical protein [Microlunatus flavus]SEP67078.1 hypothetical protein SAMN05421756_101338 [Microlunatus flavus]